MKFNDSQAGVVYISVGPDRLYLTLERNESDIWVANIKR